jgi:hypothetical protein
MGASSFAKVLDTLFTVRRGARKASTIPRHREINDYLARKICKDLEVPEV